MSPKNITMGKKVAKKGVGAGGINGVKLSVALASAKLHLSPMSCFLDAWSLNAKNPHRSQLS